LIFLQDYGHPWMPVPKWFWEPLLTRDYAATLATEVKNGFGNLSPRV
jgi:hypothetical protein